jgi:hypothetical protein
MVRRVQTEPCTDLTSVVPVASFVRFRSWMAAFNVESVLSRS